MLITGIEPLDKRRCKVLTDEDFAFVLYKGEAKRLGIRENAELSESEREGIIDDILTKRAKERALYILKGGDKTTEELRKKLSDSGYPDCVTERVLSFLSEYGLCDDRRYCSTYISQKIGKLSERMIREKLRNKGISPDIIRECLYKAKDSSDEDISELQKRACITAIYKKLGIRTGCDQEAISEAFAKLDEKKRASLFAALMRKGFGAGLIKGCLKEADLCTDRYQLCEEA